MPDKPASQIITELFETPDAIRSTIEKTRDPLKEIVTKIWRRKPRTIWFIGNGTSYFSSLSAAYLANALATPKTPRALAMTAGEFLLYPPSLEPGDVIVGISASGKFVDLIVGLQRMAQKLMVVGITNEPESPLARLATHTLLSEAGKSNVPPMTKTFSATLATAYHLVLRVLDMYKVDVSPLLAQLEKSPEDVAKALASAPAQLDEHASNWSQAKDTLVFGTGPSYVTALEAALKIKEIALIHAEAFETREMASGGITILNEHTHCLAFNPAGRGYQTTRDLSQVCRQWAGSVLEVGYDSAADVVVDTSINEYLSPIVLVPPMVYFAIKVALERGIDPDRPVWISRYLDQGLKHFAGAKDEPAPSRGEIR